LRRTRRRRRGSKLRPLAVLAAVREIRRVEGDTRPLAVAGARELVPLLARELQAGGDPLAVVEQHVEGAAVLVWVGPPDEHALRGAAQARVPIVAVADEVTMPYVLATDIVHVPPGQGFPVDEIATAVARKLGENGIALAARLPVLRGPVCDYLIAMFSRRNAIVSAVFFVPGTDMPLLTLNQLRLVLQIALAHGHELDNARLLDVAAVIGAGFGFRAVARELVQLVPFAGWALRAGVAYGGTRAIGEAAVRAHAAGLNGQASNGTT
jgi:uncharacterized protein (DUF697 family)